MPSLIQKLAATTVAIGGGIYIITTMIMPKIKYKLGLLKDKSTQTDSNTSEMINIGASYVSFINLLKA